MYNTGYPTANFTWTDNSGASSDVLFSAATDGLNVPFGFVMAERGEPGAIYFGGAKELTPLLGAETFDESSAYFSPATRFLGTAMAGQGVEVMRLVDSAATKANMGLFLTVTDADLTQYQKDDDGVRLLDENGDFIPEVQGENDVTEPGVKLTWSVRALTGEETYDTLTSTSTGAGTDATGTAMLTADAVSSITVGTGGTLYSSVPTVTLTGGGGTGATAHAVLTGAVVTSVVIDAGGTGYTAPPTVTFTGGHATTKIYPILGLEVNTPGTYGDRQGFSLYSTVSEMASVASDIKSVLYRFIPMELPLSISTTAVAIPDFVGSNYSDISFKDVAVYTKTNTNYAFKYTLGSNYVNSDTGNSVLPYTIHTYGENVGEIGTKILGLSDELDITDPYLIDLISGKDLAGHYYDHVEIESASATVTNISVVNYASGGTDGDTSFSKLQELIQTWLSGNDHGEFTNLFQHPMTHFSDPGFTMDTKNLLFNMLDLRDNFKIDVATQDISLAPNTKAQDLSAGQSLMFRAQLHPESVINGVGCTRVGIYAHAGELVNGSPYSGLIPFNLNRLIQRRDLDGATYIKGSSGGLPNSQVTIFRKPNWVADDEATRKLAWASCMNVVMHASRTVIFYPSLRTVYPNDTSLLSDDEISDRIIYMFKICRSVWAKYAGVRKDPTKLFPLINADIDNDCATAFSGDNIIVKSTVFQTAMDANLGYSTSVNLALSGNLPMRDMNFNVLVARTAS